MSFRSLDLLLIGIQDKVVTTVRPGQFFAFLLFYPTISAGPIDRYRRFTTDWQVGRSRAKLLQDLDLAVHRIRSGLLHEHILAALILRYWLGPASLFDQAPSVLSSIYAYSLYLFFVFAATKGRWLPGRYTASRVGFVTMGLMGVWHWTRLQYVAYGLYHGVLLVLSDVVGRLGRQRAILGHGVVARVVPVFVTVNLVRFGLVIFSGRLSSRYTVFGDALAGGWANWSWDATSIASPGRRAARRRPLSLGRL